MKTKWRLMCAGLLAMIVAGGALAHGYGRPYYPRNSVYFGLNVGAPWGYPYYSYPAPVYVPRVYVPSVAPVIVSPPAVYVEQQTAAPPVTTPLESGYWYYCNDSQAYYPYVNECPGGWQKVAPTPQR